MPLVRVAGTGISGVTDAYGRVWSSIGVEERGVRLVRLWFTDVLGTLKSLAISPAELENALEDGMTFDGSSIDGFSRVQEADVLAMPDADTVVKVLKSVPGYTEAFAKEFPGDDFCL